LKIEQNSGIPAREPHCSAVRDQRELAFKFLQP
jgi:hypothetical protein